VQLYGRYKKSRETNKVRSRRNEINSWKNDTRNECSAVKATVWPREMAHGPKSRGLLCPFLGRDYRDWRRLEAEATPGHKH